MFGSVGTLGCLSLIAPCRASCTDRGTGLDAHSWCARVALSRFWAATWDLRPVEALDLLLATLTWAASFEAAWTPCSSILTPCSSALRTPCWE